MLLTSLGINLTFLPQLCLIPGNTCHCCVAFKLTVYNCQNFLIALVTVEDQVSDELTNVHYRLSSSYKCELLHLLHLLHSLHFIPFS